MSESRDIARIDELRSLATETEWFEFKRKQCEPEQIGEYLSALANSACIIAQPTGYLVFGIDDETHEVVGTDFDPYNTKAKGNQDLLPWIGAGLSPNIGFEPRVIDHPDGRVVVFEVSPQKISRSAFTGKHTCAWVPARPNSASTPRRRV